MRWLTWLECCHAGIRALQEGQVKKMRQRSRGEALRVKGQNRWSALSSALALMMLARILNILEQRGNKESWLMFKEDHSKLQSNPFQQAISWVKMPGWIPKLAHKNDLYKRWKQELRIWHTV